MVKSKNIPIFYAFLSILIFLHDDLPKFLVSASRSYKSFQVLRVWADTDEKLQALKDLSTNSDDDKLQFWKFSQSLGKPSDILVSPESSEALHYFLGNNSISYTLHVDDCEKLIESEIGREKPQTVYRSDSQKFDESFFTRYQSYDEIVDFLESISTTHSEFVELSTLGKSFEGRNIPYVKIGHNNSRRKKMAIFIDAGIHAREWIAPAVALYLIHQLVLNPIYYNLLQKVDFYVAPSINPDGYEYSRLQDRLWRKTRQRSTRQGSGLGCSGVDPNRNFPFHWNESGISSNPCSEIFSGFEPLSEPECYGLANFLIKNNGTIKAYLTLHSYGNYILYPWGYAENTYPDDVNDLAEVGKAMAQAIKNAGGDDFTVGASADVLYAAAGASDDFSKSVGIKFAYTMELTSQSFILPEHKILTTANQTLPGIITLAKEVLKTESFTSEAIY